jgi:hypothetical protein
MQNNNMYAVILVYKNFNPNPEIYKSFFDNPIPQIHILKTSDIYA